VSKPAPAPRLYLVTPPIESVLTAGDIAAVLLRLNDADERTLIKRAKTLGGPVQRREIALLLDGRPELVARAGADGAHLSGIEALRAALPVLKPDRIAGAGGLRSRHDAMLAGEIEADYVMFGEPPGPSIAALEERLAWWAELFQPPCIGYAAGADEVRPIVQAGADFVALGEWIWTQPGGAAQAVAAASRNLGVAAA